MNLMPLAARTRPVPYRFEGLPLFSRNEVLLWNWYSRVGPGGKEWKTWIAEIFSHLLQKPSGQQLQLVETHLVDTQSAEKLLSFGSKQELFIGRAANSDVVLSAKAVADRHARVLVKDGGAFLEDLGSKLGTYVWEKKLASGETVALKSGDQFTVFPHRFRVQLEQCWSPETSVVVRESRLQPLSRAEFIQALPAGWRAFTLNAHPSAQQALLELSPAFSEMLQERLLGPLGLRSPRTSVPSDDALPAFVVLALVERLNRSLKFPVHFSVSRSMRSIPGDSLRGMSLNGVIGVSGLTAELRLFLPFEFLSKCKPDGRDVSEMAKLPELRWDLPISAGYVDLLSSEISGIGIGDALVPQPSVELLFPNDSGRGWAMTEEGSNFTKFRVDKYFERSAFVDTGGEAATAAAVSRPDVSALPVRLHVVVGEREFTLADIQSLTPGTVVELEASKADPVRLMVNGRLLGEGELVDVEGTLAVRVLRWRST